MIFAMIVSMVVCLRIAEQDVAVKMRVVDRVGAATQLERPPRIVLPVKAK